MSEIERTKEFIEGLIDADDIISASITTLNKGCPIGEAKKKISGLEKNFIFTRITPEEFYKNPYLQNIEIDEWQVGNIYITPTYFLDEYKTYNYKTRKRDPKTLTNINSFCYFPNYIFYPTLGTFMPYSVWMSVVPSETGTFEDFINEASGKVLLMGCGLGYVAYMLSIKDNVDEVTIVELNPEVKEMFETYLKPQMNNKISIIQGDALEFLEKEDLSSFDYCSVDIWHNAKDMFEIYIKCMLFEQRSPNTKFHYWLEEELHIALEQTWLKLMKVVLENPKRKVAPGLFTDILKSQHIETVEDVRRFMLTSKRPLIREWALKNPDKAYNHEDLEKTLARLPR